jgi:hypothetical protein
MYVYNAIKRKGFRETHVNITFGGKFTNQVLKIKAIWTENIAG